MYRLRDRHKLSSMLAEGLGNKPELRVGNTVVVTTLDIDELNS
jgi:hypothetical protein